MNKVSINDLKAAWIKFEGEERYMPYYNNITFNMYLEKFIDYALDYYMDENGLDEVKYEDFYYDIEPLNEIGRPVKFNETADVEHEDCIERVVVPDEIDETQYVDDWISIYDDTKFIHVAIGSMIDECIFKELFFIVGE